MTISPRPCDRGLREAGLYRRRGLLHLLQGDTDAALADFSRAVQLEPPTQKNWSQRAAAHGQRNDHTAAIADWTEVVRLTPKDPGAYFSRANAHYCAGDFKAAIADYTSVLRLDPAQHLGLRQPRQGSRQPR